MLIAAMMRDQTRERERIIEWDRQQTVRTSRKKNLESTLFGIPFIVWHTE